MKLSHMLLALALFVPGAAKAQDFTATRDAIDSETRGSVFPGPRDGETRPVWVWRPPTAPVEPLPVLYMMDGLGGIYTAVAGVRDGIASGRIAPVLVIALDPNPNGEARAAEYLRGWPGGSDDYAVHERWFLEQVIPWAERTQRASAHPQQRFIGGFSNGADYAWSMANTHPDIFGGALVHSPVGASADWMEANAAAQRWVVTGGTREQGGTVERSGNVPRSIAQALERHSAPIRFCLGPWAHNGRAWRDVSPGSIVWLMGLGDPAAAATPREVSSCRTAP